MRKLSLALTQKLLGDALKSRSDLAGILPLLSGQDKDNIDRIALYRANVTTNVRQALRAHYPVIDKMLGADFFNAMARVYWTTHPPCSGDLGHYGDHLADFLADFPPAQEYPFLPDVARLEWAVHRAYSAADSSLANNDVDALLAQPGTQLIASSWPVASLWHQHQQHALADLSCITWEPEGALVHRDGWDVRVVRFDYDEAIVLNEYVAQNKPRNPVS